MKTLNAGVFDVAIGCDVNALNAAMASFYNTFMVLFHHEFRLNQGGITSIIVRFDAPPTVSLAAPEVFLREARSFATGRFPEDRIEDAVQELVAGTLTISCDQVKLQIFGGAQPLDVVTTVSCGASLNNELNSEGQNVLGLLLTGAEFVVANDPATTELLNTYLAVPLVDYFDSSVAGPLQFPSIALGNFNLAPPVITDEAAGGDSYLVGYSGLNPVVLPDPGTAWPTGCFFMQVDADLLNNFMNSGLPEPSGSGGTDDLTWDYGVDSLSANVQIQPGANALACVVSVSASAGLTWHTPNYLPNVGFGADISGDVTVSAGVETFPFGTTPELLLKIMGISNINSLR
ncbi:MAG TPA: hypothetical protein VF656_10550 [Pyrinomonadaceae bacterium]|jgi:hypothetical protein